jgi:hypothetical protein
VRLVSRRQCQAVAPRFAPGGPVAPTGG